KSFKMPSGSLVIYNTYGIHRAKPVKSGSFVRKSVFFQVDSEIENSEPIIVNTEFITETNNRIAMFLGFGKAARYEVFPNTNLDSLPLNKAMVFVFAKYVIHRSLHAAICAIPKPVKSAIKSLIRR